MSFRVSGPVPELASCTLTAEEEADPSARLIEGNPLLGDPHDIVLTVAEVIGEPTTVTITCQATAAATRARSSRTPASSRSAWDRFSPRASSAGWLAGEVPLPEEAFREEGDGPARAAVEGLAACVLGSDPEVDDARPAARTTDDRGEDVIRDPTAGGDREEERDPDASPRRCGEGRHEERQAGERTADPEGEREAVAAVEPDRFAHARALAIRRHHDRDHPSEGVRHSAAVYRGSAAAHRARHSKVAADREDERLR
jgi:hypothetical protein